MSRVRVWASDNACTLIFMAIMFVLTWIWILVVNNIT